MIIFERGQPGKVFVTASEKAVLPDTQFTLSFTSDFNKGDAVVFSNAADVSLFPDRFNKFILDLSAFDAYNNGIYTYLITDQDGNVLEKGKMKLEGATVQPKQYEGEPVKNVTYGD